MKSLKQKLLVPMFVIIILIPIITLLVVNIGMNYAEEKISRDELQNIIKMSKNRKILWDSTKRNASIAINNGVLALVLQSTRFNKNIEFVVFDRNYKPLSQFNSGTALTGDFVANLQKKLPDLEAEKIYKVNFDNKNYLYAVFKMNSLLLKPNILLVSRVDFAGPIISIMNIIFISIATIAVIIALVLTSFIVKGIIKPISKLCNYTKLIGKGDFIDVPPNESFTEIYQLSSHMGDMSRQLHKLTENQKSYMQNISHELRTPLMAISSYAEGIKLGVFTDVHHASSIICEESQRLNDFVNQILTLSRIENIDYNYELSPTILSHSLLEYYQSLKGIAVKLNKELISNIKVNEVMIEANDTLLSQIIYNITSNCLRYAKHSVSITFESTDHEAIITIKDDGSGFDDKDLPHIFERFYKGKTGKFGLGLAIAKASTLQMGGTLTAMNGEGENGAIFKISFPLI
ncbi:HAMP domain-containing sensor histidine kinase [Clostridiaceae bacterium M8S5]|nr:HAMP domain-containing sensor histidine kinase [Clostridiaceae bacterium M8S5]